MGGIGTLERAAVGRVGRRIARLRRSGEDGLLSQTAFAARLGISPSYLRKIEQGGRDIPLSVLHRAARELGVEPADLFGSVGRAPGLDDVQVPLMRLIARLRRNPEGIPTLVQLLDSLRLMLGGA